jgi:hypothetical protein
MRHQDDACASCNGSFNRWNRSSQASVIRYSPITQRNIEILSNQDSFTGERKLIHREHN